MLQTPTARRLFTAIPLLLLMAGCAQLPGKPATTASPCVPCKEAEPARPAVPPLQAAQYSDLPGWRDDNPLPAFQAFVNECVSLSRQPLWRATCASALALPSPDADAVRTWFEVQLRPWQLVNPDGTRSGLITGYYEPVLSGSRTRKPPYTTPVFGVPDDLIVVDLGELYPELKNMRLRGRIEGRKLVPFYSRSEWTQQEDKRKSLLWVDDAVDFFFMQIQGSGQIALDDGSRIRLNYADQNGHPYHSIGRWLIDKGELKPEQASMQGIKAWARANPRRLQELLNQNPSLVFFRELKAEGSGPQGAMGIALTPERSIAVDPRTTPLGAPVWLSTTQPNSDQPLQRLMLAQDTGGAIRGPVRADFYWGSGPAAGAQAGRMRQTGSMWVLLPRDHEPAAAKLP
ncbi:MAG: MltA domain-containing protein [Rhodocyclaceae bacterium]|nr:MltA domain-containing protein [Rhodocyclaceae bacterium]